MLSFYIIKLLSQEIGITTEEICLTLYKIKLNDTFARLGDEFGISASKCKCFSKNSSYFSTLFKTIV